MATWQPQPQGLSDLLQLLKEAVNPNASQTAITEKLEYFNKVPDYNSYLVYILTQMPQEDAYTRTLAGLNLKNNIRTYFNTIPPPVMDYVKECCVQHIGEPDSSVRKAVGLVITAIVTRGQVHNWPQILQILMEKLDSGDTNLIEGAFDTLRKICEDSPRDLDQDIDGIRPLNYMIPKFISFFDNPNPKLRVHAIAATNQFIMMRSQSLMINIEQFVNALFSRASDAEPEVRRHICSALVMLLEVRPDTLIPQLPNVVEYMIFSTQDMDEQVALEACEFWLAFAEQDDLRENLRPYLPRVIPVLLAGMVYSEMDLLTLGGDEDDAHIEDSEQDIKPRFHRAAVVEHEHTTAATNAEPAKKQSSGGDGEDDEDDDDEDDFDDDEFYDEWNLRKCSAAALDVLATAFEGDLVKILLPLLKEQLFHEDWKHRECGILALGAAAEGGMDEVAPHLPDLVPYLVRNLNDPKPLVRSITCWALSRYARWCVDVLATPDGRKLFFEPVVEGLLKRALDNNKRVQEAACSAFATLEEEATLELVPYLQPILMNLSAAFSKYQHKNLLILYDALGTLAENVGPALAEPAYIELLMPPLIQKWQEVTDNDTDLFPLLECLTSVSTALGVHFKPFAEPVFTRCVNLVYKTLEGCQLAALDPTLDQPDKDFMIVALDLLSGIVQGLNTSVESLVASARPSLVQLLSMCINDPVPEVRQSSYALLGDLAISCFEHVRSVLPQFLPHLLEQVDPTFEHVSVCNNAAWAAGEIALQWKQEIQPYVEALLQRLFPLVLNQETPRTLLENTAITIGRLGFVCPTVVAPHLELFIHSWLQALNDIRDNEEKESAFNGLCEMIKVNPQGVVKEILFFCSAVANFQTITPHLHEAFGNILVGYKNMFGAEQWEQALTTLPPQTRKVLAERYGM
ncbi:armadillo-type protein [Umbelopsis sp. AD052]|nr:armadillo-type protein [Umbelopsis sp. AD052]